jgi:hypothetical protein
VRLAQGAVEAAVLPGEGGVLSGLRVHGREVLCRTPWAEQVTTTPRLADTESEWVERWRGGWQLCFPTAGQPDPRASEREAFHGTASQAAWRVLTLSAHDVTMAWHDTAGLSAQRRWLLHDSGVSVETRVHNAGARARAVIIAEHLILGGDVLSAPLRLDVPTGTGLWPLDYGGRPAGDSAHWPGDPADRWVAVDETTPARVAGLTAVHPRRIDALGDHVTIRVEWSGDALAHALLWEEIGQSTEPPWNGAIRALGIEPSSAPHGAGTAHPGAAIQLASGESLEWGARLSVTWAPDPQ